MVINPEAYPDRRGDGAGGGLPPGGCTSGGDCSPATYASGRPNYTYGDVDTTHTQLDGIWNKATNNVEISGCFKDEDGFGGLGTVYVELTASGHQLPSTVDIYSGQAADCVGSPTGTAGVADISLTITQPDKGKGYDGDGDGNPTKRELGDDNACGRRDPYNGNDYYDVSVPRDGVIDLSNDILGVIVHYSPGGYVSGDA